MGQSAHPARAALIEYGRALPAAWAAWDNACAATGTSPGNAPAGAEQLAMMRLLINERGRVAREALAADVTGGWLRVQTLAYRTLSAWRYTQGIYRFDSDVYAAVCDTPLSGEIPANILRTLPEWVVYIETPGLVGYAGPIYGAWVQFSELGAGSPAALQVSTLAESGHLEISVLSVGDGVSLSRQIETTIERLGGVAEDIARNRAYLEPIINLALYLCARPGDITGRRGAPATPVASHTKHGVRLFPAAAESSWDVGVRMGAALRMAASSGPSGTADGGVDGVRMVRGHVRRAHWHTILSGPRLRADGSTIPPLQRKAELRWMPPIPVALDGPDDLVAVVRTVKP